MCIKLCQMQSIHFSLINTSCTIEHMRPLFKCMTRLNGSLFTIY